MFLFLLILKQEIFWPMNIKFLLDIAQQPPLEEIELSIAQLSINLHGLQETVFSIILLIFVQECHP